MNHARQVILNQDLDKQQTGMFIKNVKSIDGVASIEEDEVNI